MNEREVLHSQDETQADRFVRGAEGWQWKEMGLRALIGLGAAAVAIVVILLFTKVARAPSTGPSSDCTNTVSMAETLSTDCTRK